MDVSGGEYRTVRKPGLATSQEPPWSATCTVLSYQPADFREIATEDSNTAAHPVRNTSYEETIRQLGLQGNKALRLGADTTHKLTYGVDNTKSA